MSGGYSGPSGVDERRYEEDKYRPWYRGPTNDHPFRLVRTINYQKADAPAFKGLSIFPWDKESLSTLWEGSLDMPENRLQWQTLVSDYWDAVAVGSDYQLNVFFTQSKRRPISIKLFQDEQKLLEVDKMCIGWAMKRENRFEPLVIFSRGSLLHIFDLERMCATGYHRGHGGAITSVAVHPTRPHIFATTSRDYTTRIYDLMLQAEIPLPAASPGRKKFQIPNPNPHWLPNKKPSLAGAAHGLRLHPSEKEGGGMGRCICVMMGGRSGGHQAAVLGAAFHPVFPIIATCGMDRTVKIWPVLPHHMDQIKREDKPIFSSSMVHKARVMSINWLQYDLLLTHSGPAINRKEPLNPNNKETYIEAGELTLWRWLSVDRFFPATQETVPITALRGISSDYQESASFKIISTHAFPAETTHLRAPLLNLFHLPTHDPLILFVYPNAPEFTMLNAAHMQPRKPPPFPSQAEKASSPPAEPPSGPPQEDAEQSAELASAAASQLHLGGDNEEEDQGGDEDEDDASPRRRDKGKGKDKAHEQNLQGDEESDDNGQPDISDVINRRIEVEPPPILGWEINVAGANEEEANGRMLMNVAMGMGGRMIIGVGTGGSVWVWRYDTQ